MGGKFSNENLIWSFRQMPRQKAGGHTAREFRQGECSKEEKDFQINVLEQLALKSVILTFTKNLSVLTIHVEVDNKVALAYLLKMGGTRNPQLLKSGKLIWNYLLFHKITVTGEYLPSKMNLRADWESKNATDSSAWKFHRKVFLKMTKLLRTLTVGLLRSNHRRCSARKSVLRNFTKFTGKHLRQSRFFNKVAGLIFLTFN